MSFEVVYTDNFDRELKHLAKKFRSVKKDLEKLITKLEKNPSQGFQLVRIALKSVWPSLLRLKVNREAPG